MILVEILIKYVIQFYQLKIRHKIVKVFFIKIKIIDILKYWKCKTEKQIVIYFYIEC